MVADGYVPVRNGDRAPAGWRKNIYCTTAGGAGDGGETSTVHDLARFLQSLRAGKLLPMPSVEAMLTPKVDAADEGPGWTYGFGCFIALGESGEIVRWGHTGEEDGVSCRLDYYPAQDLDVVVLGNQSGCAGRVAADIRNVIVGQH
jgi:CubicO group peptidase (beta-lactamase class C family)